MKKVTIAICVCLFFILIILIASILMIRSIRVRLPNNLVPFIYIPLSFICALLFRAYDDADGAIALEYHRSSYTSTCAQKIMQDMSNLFVVLGLSVNLAMWIDYVFCSLYSSLDQFMKYLRFRCLLFRSLTFSCVILVLAPFIAVTILECKNFTDQGYVIYITTSFAVFALLTPIVGSALLLILRRHFSEFYKDICGHTLALIAC